MKKENSNSQPIPAPDLTPAQKRVRDAIAKERSKTADQRAEDIAYTINHAFVCAATDVLDPFVAAYLDFHISQCNKTHDHSHDHGGHHDHNHSHSHDHNCSSHSCSSHNHHHDDHHHASAHNDTPKAAHSDSCPHHDENPNFWKSLKHWVITEAVGDIGAVPITIAAQRYMPGTLARISNGIESAVGGIYKVETQEMAYKWADKQGIDRFDPRTKEYAKQAYDYEIDHFGQAAVWTVASTGINVAAQKFLFKNSKAWGTLIGFKTLGAAQTAALLIGGRGLAPEKFKAWDEWNAENIYAPATRGVSKLLGIDTNAVERALEKGHAHHAPDLTVATPSEHEGVATEPKPLKLAARG